MRGVPPRRVESRPRISRLLPKTLLVQVVSDVPDELQGLATVHHGKHEVAFAAGESLGATLGSGLYCRIRAVELGGKKKCDGRISQGHERLVLKDGTAIFYGSFVSSEKNLDCRTRR